ncbi:MAG TPA: alkaline phosphatase PhoX [Woeseiaceae bacterium]|nr:alkaline phosphatase PhoX [Woeseiaceae bacterium]
MLDRRAFLRRAASLGAGSMFAPSLASLSNWSRIDETIARTLRPNDNAGLGPLVTSVDCPEFQIPDSFRCIRISRSLGASAANPNFIVPNALDGMATFSLPNGDIRLIRNHEMNQPAARAVPLGNKPYDPKASGGTTSLTVRLEGTGADRSVRVLDEYVSIGGTHVNCAGGRTPWESWLTCEETTAGPSSGFERPHGYIFEVPVAAKEAVDPVALTAMGRFVHEAVAVDPRDNYVYETEDMRWNAANEQSLPGAGFYRFVPRTPQRLAEGGQLQILAVRDRPRHNTVIGQTVGARLPAHWINIEAPDPADAERDPSAVFREGLSKGAAIFDRLEGCFWADDSCYFVATSGGTARAGQVWRYVPESNDSGYITLVFESPSRSVLDAPDNICVSPRGGIVICEDGSAEQYVRALSTSGQLVNLALAPLVTGEPSPREFAGCCFSPDGEVLFFNVQGSTTSYGTRPGTTYALWGPWTQAVGV